MHCFYISFMLVFLAPEARQLLEQARIIETWFVGIQEASEQLFYTPILHLRFYRPRAQNDAAGNSNEDN